MLSISNLHCDKNIIEENKIKDFLSDQLKSIEKKLRDHNIDVDKIKKYALKESHNVYLKNGKLSNFLEKINLFAKNLYSRNSSSNDTNDKIKNLEMAINILAIITVINTMRINIPY